MGKRGPKRTPTSVLKLHGSKRAKHRTNEPEVVEPTLAAPKTLGEHGRHEWDRLAPQLANLGVLSENDLAALHTLCRTFDEVARLDALLLEVGEYKTTTTGYVSPHPAIGQRFKWLEIRRRYENEFGLTPASRAGVETMAQGSKLTTRQRSKWEGLLAGPQNETAEFEKASGMYS